MGIAHFSAATFPPLFKEILTWVSRVTPDCAEKFLICDACFW